MFHTIVLAGDRPGDALAQMSPGGRKAFLPLNGRPMILYVLEALLAAPGLGEITVVANTVTDLKGSPDLTEFLERRDAAGRIGFQEGAGSPATSVLKIVEHLPPGTAVLVTTADNPLLTVETLTSFCGRAGQADHMDVAVGLARESDIRRAFPDSRRTFIRLGGEGYSGCNLFVLMPGTGSKAAQAWRAVERRRKKPWQFILHFGVLPLARALIGRLSLDQAMAAVSRTLGLRARAIVLDDANAAMDVDRPEHIDLVSSVIAARRGHSV